MSKSVKKVKVSPLVRVFDAIRDEKLDVIIGKEWVEVNESEWKRLKESQTKQGDVLIPTFVSEGEGMGDIKGISKSSEEVSGDDEWYGADEQVEEEE